MNPLSRSSGEVDAFSSFRLPTTNREERVNRGKQRRIRAPHSELGTWHRPVSRPSIVDFIEHTHESRLDWLLGVRVARMAASPFGVLRGTAGLMMHDIAPLPTTGINTTVCGDAHVGNIGFYRSSEGELVIDLNDFDEAHAGSWEWDVRRLTASLHVAGRVNGLSEIQCEAAVKECVISYRDEISFLSKQPLLWRAYNRMNVDDLAKSVDDDELRDAILSAKKSALKRTDDRKLPKITGGATTAAHIEDDAPLITHPNPQVREQIADGLDAYLGTLTPQWRRIVGGYSLVDIAHKVVGVGSVGMRAWVALLVGSRDDDILFLQLKQAHRSVLAPYVHGDKVWHSHQGQRVVEYQQQLQTVSDPLLGWTTVGEHQYYVRQWRNMKGGVPVEDLNAGALADYSRITGHLLAKGHARTSGASVISGYLGKSDAPVDGFARWARVYADQMDADHTELTKAVKAGRLPYENVD